MASEQDRVGPVPGVGRVDRVLKGRLGGRGDREYLRMSGGGQHEREPDGNCDRAVPAHPNPPSVDDEGATVRPADWCEY